MAWRLHAAMEEGEAGAEREQVLAGMLKEKEMQVRELDKEVIIYIYFTNSKFTKSTHAHTQRELIRECGGWPGPA